MKWHMQFDVLAEINTRPEAKLEIIRMALEMQNIN